LPPKLIKAFSSTLEDSIESELLLHVVDASDPFIEDRIAVVNHILDDIGAKQERVMVYNKIDKVSPERLAELQETYGTDNCVWISTYTKE
jgi:GTP-binding protein HflX